MSVFGPCSLYDRSGNKAKEPQDVHTMESLVPHRGLICQVRMAAVSVVYYIAGLFSSKLAKYEHFFDPVLEGLLIISTMYECYVSRVSTIQDVV